MLSTHTHTLNHTQTCIHPYIEAHTHTQTHRQAAVERVAGKQVLPWGSPGAGVSINLKLRVTPAVSTSLALASMQLHPQRVVMSLPSCSYFIANVII